MTSAEFLNLACQWAFEHDTTLIDDFSFLPCIRSRGVSDEAINRFKRDLERRGALTNHSVIGGWNGFTLSRGVFHQHVRQTIPRPVLRRAKSLHERWMHSPGEPFTSLYLAEQLDISERHAHYILDLLCEE
jgi:hypothetical protein